MRWDLKVEMALHVCSLEWQPEEQADSLERAGELGTAEGGGGRGPFHISHISRKQIAIEMKENKPLKKRCSS